jgi:hypothetical protein
MKTNKQTIEQIKELVKPNLEIIKSSSVDSLCEPNKCDSDCNSGTALYSPDAEHDLLF